MFYSLEACRVAGILLQPVMPTKMASLLDRLGVANDQRYFEHATQLSNQPKPLGNMDGVLFPRL